MSKTKPNAVGRLTVDDFKCAVVAYPGDARMYLLHCKQRWDDGSRARLFSRECVCLSFSYGTELYITKEDVMPIDLHRGAIEAAILEAVPGVSSVVWDAPGASSSSDNAGTPSAARVDDAAPSTPVVSSSPAATMPAAGVPGAAGDAMGVLANAMLGYIMPAVDERLKGIAGCRPVQSFEIINGDSKVEIKETTHPDFLRMVGALKCDIPVYLYGPAGTGKSHIAAQLAKALGLELYSSAAVLNDYQLTGSIDLNGNFVETPFYRAWSRGGLFLLDEIDASNPAALVIINQALANGVCDFFGIGNVKRHDDFRVIATANTLGRGADDLYTARETIDAATLDRFKCKFFVGYNHDIEMSISGNNAEWVSFTESIREAVTSTGSKMLVTYRQTAAARKLLAVQTGDGVPVFSASDVIRHTMTAGEDAEMLRMIAARLDLRGNRYADAFISIAGNSK